MYSHETRQERKVSSEGMPLEVLPSVERSVMELEDTPYSMRLRFVLVVLSFSPWGNMARVAMQKLITYTNAYVFYQHGTIIWINFTSCLIMGAANASLKLWDCFNKDAKRPLNFKEMPLHAGVTAGFCACFSTLSALLMELFFKTTNNTELKTPNQAYGVMEFFAVILGQMGLCFFGMTLGRDFGYLVDAKLVPLLRPFLNERTRKSIEVVIMLLSLGVYIANVVCVAVLPFDNWYRQEYALVVMFGLVGTILRVELLYFNDFWKWFPLGTFFTNVIATLIISVLQILMYGYKKGTKELLVQNETAQWVLRSITNGLVGSLSTIAAFCYEIQNFEMIQHRYYYFMATFVTCWSVVILIVGSYQWAVGLTPV